MWHTESYIDADVSVEKLWDTFMKYINGKLILPGGDIFQPEGEIAVGTTIAITPKGQETVQATVIEFEPMKIYADKTEFHGFILIFKHIFQSINNFYTRLLFTLTVESDKSDTLCREIGSRISSDFPEHLRELITEARKEEN